VSSTALFLRFLRYGALAFGGPVAQVAHLRDELVERERWVTPEEFQRALALYQLLPGPEATELCAWFGMRKGGRLGGVLAALGFVLPGVGLMLAAGWAWRTAGARQWIPGEVMLCLQAAVAALVVRASWRLGRGVVGSAQSGALVGSAFLASVAGAPFWLVLGLPALGLSWRRRAGGWLAVAGLLGLVGWCWQGHVPEAPVPGPVAAQAAGGEPATPWALLLLGLRAGLFSFGGAYTALPIVRHEAVVAHGWLSDSAFLDGVALGGILPAPLIVFTTFVGYSAGGFPGALAATAGTFLPAFAMVVLLHERLERWMADARLHALLDGVMLGVVGLVAATAVQVSGPVVGSAGGLAVALCALGLLWKLPAAWSVPTVVLGAAAAGGVSSLLSH
jgi:chromate transporter